MVATQPKKASGKEMKTKTSVTYAINAHQAKYK
jgi:hypothetical protein